MRLECLPSKIHFMNHQRLTLPTKKYWLKKERSSQETLNLMQTRHMSSLLPVTTGIRDLMFCNNRQRGGPRNWSLQTTNHHCWRFGEEHGQIHLCQVWSAHKVVHDKPYFSTNWPSHWKLCQEHTELWLLLHQCWGARTKCNQEIGQHWKGAPDLLSNACRPIGVCSGLFRHHEHGTKNQTYFGGLWIVKIAQGCKTELEELKRAWIRLIGWVNSDAIYKAMIKSSPKTSIEAQAMYLHQRQGSTQGKYPYYRWHSSYKSALGLAGEGHQLPELYVLHILQKVRVLLAIVNVAVVKFSWFWGFNSKRNIFQFVTEALDLCRSKETEELSNLHPIPNVNWLSILPPTHESQRHKSLNDARELTYIRCQSFGDLRFQVDAKSDETQSGEEVLEKNTKVAKDDLSWVEELEATL